MSVAALWSFRLGFHLIRRLLHEPEDRRYVAMKAAWGGSAQSKLFQFYQYQAAACVFFAIPALIGSQSKVPFGLWSDYAGILIAIVALTGEAIADRQLAAHRAGRSTNGNGLATVCQLGLWRYSRHPNYFFEWLYWWSYVGLAVSSSWGWLTLMAPLLMYHFIVHVTGIPPTEEHLLNTRGESYRRYQEETSSFFPWFPRGLDRSR
jgi:steroid 5-alpha reductase family enzyme